MSAYVPERTWVQAYLEAEPHLRGHKEHYIRRYQELARQDLEKALSGWEAYLTSKGKASSKIHGSHCGLATRLQDVHLQSSSMQWSSVMQLEGQGADGRRRRQVAVNQGQQC